MHRHVWPDRVPDVLHAAVLFAIHQNEHLRDTQASLRAAANRVKDRLSRGHNIVHDRDEIILITSGGVLIRTRVHEIREMGRNTQGVTLIQLDEGEKLAGLEKLLETEYDDKDEAASSEPEPDAPPGEAPPEGA